MRTLAKLYFTKSIAKIRYIFSKPLSAIVTGIVALLYGSMLFPVVANSNTGAMDAQTAQPVIWLVLGVVFVVQCASMLQKRRSLFFMDDAYYLYTGPYTSKQILRYYSMDVLFSALLMGLISMLPIVMYAAVSPVNLVFLLLAFVAATLLHYFLLALTGALYLRRLVSGKNSASQMAVPAVLLLLAAAVALHALASVNFNTSLWGNAFLNSPLFSFVPLFGWAKASLTGWLTGNYISLLGGAAALLLAALAARAWLINTKGDFTEASMQDAESFTAYYEKAKSGKTDETTGKLHKATVSFGKKGNAMFSKSLLVALKTRNLVRVQDVVVVAIYTAMALWMQMPYAILCGMILFFEFSIISSSSLLDDLKHHYVYLIPAGGVQKLAATLALPLLKSCLITSLSLLISGLVVGEALNVIAPAILLGCTFVLLFTAGNVFSLRILKSRSNKMVENTLRMLVVLVALLPSLGILIAVIALTGSFQLGLILPIVTVGNLLVGLGILALCAPMMQGNELTE